MRNLYLALSWYIASISALAFSLIFLMYISYPRVVSAQHGPHYQVYQAVPQSAAGEQSFEITASDARAPLIKRFFASYRSPLAEEADTFISVAEKYHLDFRLLPAIAMHESGGGKAIPSNSFNPFGFGIYAGNVTRFASWAEGIDRVGKAMKTDYMDRGLKTPEEIMSKYTPSSNGAWAAGIKDFMNEIK